ncbi:MAG: hypothetical protein OXB93_05635 [Cytophagales bacterium]|nr:hypothetical protein [Cytophagales bacterium]
MNMTNTYRVGERSSALRKFFILFISMLLLGLNSCDEEEVNPTSNDDETDKKEGSVEKLDERYVGKWIGEGETQDDYEFKENASFERTYSFEGEEKIEKGKVELSEPTEEEKKDIENSDNYTDFSGEIKILHKIKLEGHLGDEYTEFQDDEDTPKKYLILLTKVPGIEGLSEANYHRKKFTKEGSDKIDARIEGSWERKYTEPVLGTEVKKTQTYTFHDGFTWDYKKEGGGVVERDGKIKQENPSEDEISAYKAVEERDTIQGTKIPAIKTLHFKLKLKGSDLVKDGVIFIEVISEKDLNICFETTEGKKYVYRYSKPEA